MCEECPAWARIGKHMTTTEQDGNGQVEGRKQGGAKRHRVIHTFAMVMVSGGDAKRQAAMNGGEPGTPMAGNVLAADVNVPRLFLGSRS